MLARPHSIISYMVYCVASICAIGKIIRGENVITNHSIYQKKYKNTHIKHTFFLSQWSMPVNLIFFGFILLSKLSKVYFHLTISFTTPGTYTISYTRQLPSQHNPRILRGHTPRVVSFPATT